MQYYFKDVLKFNVSNIFKQNFFELFGVDVIINENLEPYILEINIDPGIIHKEE